LGIGDSCKYGNVNTQGAWKKGEVNGATGHLEKNGDTQGTWRIGEMNLTIGHLETNINTHET
jgi:hypothetical protein